MSAARTRRRRTSAPARPARSTPPLPLLFALLIVVAGVATYSNSLGGQFIWDDQTSIVTNRTIQHLWPLSDPLTPPRETPVAGRPLVNLSFAINYALGGLNETGYHAGNIAIHIACALLLFAIVRRTLLNKESGEISQEARPLFQPADTTAVVVALLWMVHPLQSEAVNYITQRSESLMALFFLLTLYAAIRARPARPVRLPPPRFALPASAQASARSRRSSREILANEGGRRAAPKRSEGGKPDTTYNGACATKADDAPEGTPRC
jgi:protein O-mannosyl-transferase